jgi:hypothetical protein
MNIISKITHRFFPLIVINLIFIGNSCFLSPKERSNQLDTQIDDTIFSLTFELVPNNNNPADPNVLLTWDPVIHEFTEGYNIYRHDEDTLTETLTWYNYIYDTIVLDSIVDSTLGILPQFITVESTFVLGSTGSATNVYLDTSYHVDSFVRVDYTIEVFFTGGEHTYFSNHVVVE